MKGSLNLNESRAAMDVKISDPLEVLVEDDKLCRGGTENATVNNISNQSMKSFDSLPINETELLQSVESEMLCKPAGESEDHDMRSTPENSDTKRSETELQTLNISYSGPLESCDPEDVEMANTLSRYRAAK